MKFSISSVLILGLLFLVVHSNSEPVGRIRDQIQTVVVDLQHEADQINKHGQLTESNHTIFIPQPPPPLLSESSEQSDEIGLGKQVGSSLSEELSSLDKELLETEGEVDDDIADGGEGDENTGVRSKRTARLLNRIYCSVFRSSSTCVNSQSSSIFGSNSNSQQTTTNTDDFWLNYLNNNGTDFPSTTTRRPTIFQLKHRLLRRLFPRLFGGVADSDRRGDGFFAQLLQAPVRLWRRLNLGGLSGGASNTPRGNFNSDADF